MQTNKLNFILNLKRIIMKSNIIKETIKELGITQKQLAENIGVHENTVSGWARGTEIPQMVIKLLELLIIEKKYNTAKKLFCDLES